MAERKQTRVNDLMTFSLTQILDPTYFNLENEKAQSYMTQYIQNKDLKGIMTLISYLLKQCSWECSEMYGIIHDKDVRYVWDESVLSMVYEPKSAHVHISVRFKDKCNANANVNTIAKVLGVEPQYIEKPKSGRYSWNNQLAYLIHAKDKDKYQYSPNEVYTYKGESYTKIYHENIEMWNKGAVKKENQQTVEDVEWLEHGVLTGQIVRSQIMLTNSYYKIYSQHKRRIDDAFDTYTQRKMYKALEKLKSGEFKTSVYYIMGAPGSGKTRFAIEYANHLVKRAKEELGEDWSICSTASTNPVDDYMGEEVLIMDDVRGSTMRADDWLKLLDPYNASPSSARYRNKVVTARVIIITAVIPPYEFFYYTKGVGQGAAQSEAIDQFLRRLLSIVEVINYDKLIVKRALPTDKSRSYSVGTNGGSVIRTESNYDIVYDSKLFNQSRGTIIEKLSSEVIENNGRKIP